ncbi:NADH-quinone oxidoreductase subunit C [Streptomyces sp. FB2]|uniref:NADH-quinone oxidoreductase subunit C n=1 Tax=Streptomyces sp. FB2 TaxID=2902454 RepID=UPI001F2ABF93|nr:NADH-quinone oxidoreductase subunit C [Streptomyces sp. FB2]MCF2538010.1 NADH-quinone oxidoreductase subunit C [Streptomyces sp. FB2]
MTTIGWLPAPAEELFGPEATAEESYDVLTVDVPPATWITALETARDTLGCTYFDWLSAVDEPGTGFRVAAHVAALGPVRRLLVRTTVPHESPTLPSAVGVYAGATWHERETHEMFGVEFTDHPGLDHLLLPENFEGHPLRKDFVLAARVAKAWPGAKEPGESEHGGPKRRQMLPPGVPDPNEWGPLKGQLPPAPARPARAAGRTAGERPVRRTRSAAEGSATQPGAPTEAAPAAGTRPRRTRTASQGSASQTVTGADAPPTATGAEAQTPVTGAGAEAQPPATGAGAEAQTPVAGTGSEAPVAGAEAGTPAEPGTTAPSARRARSSSEGSASQRTPATPRRSRSASEGSASQRPAPEAPTPTAAAPGGEASAPATPDDGPVPGTPAPDAAAPAPGAPAAPRAPRSPDAPWHHARPAFEEPAPEPTAHEESNARGEQQDDPRPGEETAEQPDGPADDQTDQPADHPTEHPDEGTDPAGGPR